MREGKNFSKIWKKITAFLLVSVMLLSSIPGPDSIAADNGENIAEEGIHPDGNISTEYDDSQLQPDNQEPSADPIEGDTIPTEPVLPGDNSTEVGPETGTEIGTDEVPTDTVQPDNTFTDGDLPEDNLEEGDEAGDTQTLVFEDGSMKVTATAEAGVIPADTFLQVIPVVQENTETLVQYQELEGKLQEKAALEGYSVTGFLAYDITFVNAEGLQIEPNGDVAVTIEYSQAAIPTSVFEKQTENNNVTLMYLERYDDGQAEVIDMGQFLNGPLKVLDLIADNQVARAEFTDSRASLYTFVWSGTEIEETPDEEKNENLDGEEPLNFVPMTGKLEIIAEDVVLRAEPSIEGEIVEVVPAGTYLELLGMAENGTESWYKALYEGAEVYVRSDMAKVVEEDASEKEEEESEDTPQMLEYENDSVKIAVSEVTEGAIPEGASLRVVPVEPDNANTAALHQEVQQKLEEKAENEEYDITGFLAYDITFVDENGNKLEPDGQVQVSMEYKEAAVPENVKDNATESTDVTVMHLEEDAEGQVAQVVDMGQSNQLRAMETTADKEVQKAEFVTESFSVYTITWTYSNKEVKITAYYGYVDSDNKFQEFEGGKNQKISLKEKGPYDFHNYSRSSEYSDYTFRDVHLDRHDGNTFRYLRINSSNRKQYVQSSSNGKDYRNWFQLQGDEHKENIYFIYTKKLTTVETVDSTSAGITMRMKDYSTAAEGLSGTIGGPYGGGNVKQGLLDSLLKDGYPKVRGKDTSLASLFNNGRAVNHLFRKDIYEETGYFEYSSFENYAYLGDSSEFTVYKHLGTPKNDNQIFYKRGNFMPYNRIEAGKLSTNENLYDGDGELLPENHPRRGEALYITQGENNYFFGMYLEASFAQPRNGQVEHNGILSSMRYEFNGDDDLWVYIDNVLVLDIGGIHDAHSGYIDFATGEVHVVLDKKNSVNTTIKEMYKKAGTFPDGTKWNDNKVDNYFKGNTFIDYSSHTLKMFYMERGAAASNLHMKFNIPVIPPGQVQVKKELSNTDKEKYANVEFAFQAFAQEIIKTDTSGHESYGNAYVPLRSALLSDGTAVTFEDDVSFEENGEEYDNVFFLKPGQTAAFSNLQQNRKYYVIEVGVKASEYDEISVNNTVHTSFDENEQTSGEIADIETSKEEVGKRPLVVYTNNCSAANNRELRISKKMDQGAENGDVFKFKVHLESQNGELAPYDGNYYLQDASGNYYSYNENGVLENKGVQATVCGSANAGVISGIPAGYTVIITQILSGTEFKVEEIELDFGRYMDYVKTMKEGTYGEATITGADGSILLGKNAEVTITNKLRRSIKVTKKWIDSADTHSSIYVGLYKAAEGTLTPVENAWKELNSQNAFTETYTSLTEDEYEVRELRPVLENEASDFTINNIGYKAVSEGEEVSIGGIKYSVSYSAVEEGGSVVITNTVMKKLEVEKIWTKPDDFTGEINHSSVEIALYKSGTMVKDSQKTLSSENDWKHIYNIPAADDLSSYSVKEVVLVKNSKKEDEYISADEKSYIKLKDIIANVPVENIYQVGYSQGKSEIADKKFTITNTLILGSIELKKIGDGDEALAGAKFKVVGNNNYTEELETQADGKALFDKLLPGTYTITEVQSPAGYSLLVNPITVTVGTTEGTSENGYTVVGETSKYYYDLKVNVKNNKHFTMPEGGGTGTKGIILAGIFMMLAAGGYSLLFYRRRRRPVRK